MMSETRYFRIDDPPPYWPIPVDCTEMTEEVAHIQAENAALKREIATKDGALQTCVYRLGKAKEENAARKRKFAEIKKWQGVMHTPAYGEWNGDKIGWWTRGAHVFGTPQVENMCKEILALLTAEESE